MIQQPFKFFAAYQFTLNLQLHRYFLDKIDLVLLLHQADLNKDALLEIVVLWLAVAGIQARVCIFASTCSFLSSRVGFVWSVSHCRTKLAAESQSLKEYQLSKLSRWSKVSQKWTMVNRVCTGWATCSNCHKEDRGTYFLI